MVLDPLTGKTLLEQIDKRARDEVLIQKKSNYWLRCPSCGRLVVKKELINKGCFVCGWRGTEEEAGAAKHYATNRVTTDTSKEELQGMGLYRLDCPQCQAKVVRTDLIEKGCYRCGWKPTE